MHSKRKKHRNKIYYKGEHKGERVISDMEFDLILSCWWRDKRYDKLKFLAKIEKPYKERNCLNQLSNLERLERIRLKFGD